MKKSGGPPVKKKIIKDCANKKIIKDSIKEKVSTKGADALFGFSNVDDHDGLDWVDFRITPTPLNKIIQIGKDLVEWATTSADATKIRKFFRGRGIDYDTIGRWRKRCPEFDRYYRFSLDAIGDRREDAAYNKLASEGLVKGTMAIYDPDYKELLAWQSTLTKDDDKNRDIRVVLQAYPNSPLVPEKE